MWDVGEAIARYMGVGEATVGYMGFGQWETGVGKATVVLLVFLESALLVTSGCEGTMEELDGYNVEH